MEGEGGGEGILIYVYKSSAKSIIATLQEEQGVITEEVADAMMSLWNNTAIQQTLKQQMDHSAL